MDPSGTSYATCGSFRIWDNKPADLIAMKLLKKITAAAFFAVATTGLFASTPFFITFDFDTGASPIVTDPSGAFASVGDFTGGTLTGGKMTADLSSDSPASFSFDFDLAEGFTASIFSIGFGANYVGTIATVTGVTKDALLLGGDFIEAGTSKDVAFLTSLSGLTDGTLTFEAVGFDGTVALEDFQIFGFISAVPETSTVLFSGVAGFFAFVIARRRRAAVQSAA